MIKNTYKNQKNFHESMLSIIQNLEAKLEGIQNSMSYNLEKTPGKTFHLLSKLLDTPKTSDERLIYNYILSTAYRSEITSHGAGYVSVLFFIELAKEFLRNHDSGTIKNNQQELMSSFEQYYANLHKSINENAKPVKEADVISFIQNICEEKTLADAVYTAVKLAGLEGKVFVENGKVDDFIIESKTGYEFKCKPYDWLLDKFNNSWQRNHCKVLLVDGLVESVSEIEGILQSLHETKQPMAFIAHGFSEEVVATLKANQERGNFDAIAIRIMPDVNSLNMINDMSCVCSTEHISHLKGQMLTFVKFDELPTIDSIKCYKDKIVIQNVSSVSSVNAQIQYLLEKRDAESAIEDIQNIIDLRLRSLVGNSVVINLPNMSAANTDALRIKIDNALRSCKSLINYGVCNTPAILVPVSHDPTTELFEVATKKTIARLSELSVLTISIAALLAFKGGLLMLSSQGAVIGAD